MQYRNAKDRHDNLKRDRLHATATNEQQARVIRQQLNYLKSGPVLKPADGEVIASQWRIKKVVVDLGEHKGIFPGLIMNVFTTDAEGKRIVKARIQVMTAKRDSCTCNILGEQIGDPVIKGDKVQVPVIPIPASKRFVIAGPFGPNAPYTKQQLIGLIKLNGGLIQDHVDLFTDYLIKGETMVAAASAATADKRAEEARDARAEVQIAKELSVTTVDYLDFISYIRQ